MPSATVEAAFQARLASQWTQTPVLDPGGSQEEPPDVDAFVVVQYPVVEGVKPVLNGRYFEDGAARVILNIKQGLGLHYGLTLADTLATIFRDQRFSGVETFTPSAPIVNDANDDGQWFELAVVVPYRYQFS